MARSGWASGRSASLRTRVTRPALFFDRQPGYTVASAVRAVALRVIGGGDGCSGVWLASAFREELMSRLICCLTVGVVASACLQTTTDDAGIDAGPLGGGSVSTNDAGGGSQTGGGLGGGKRHGWWCSNWRRPGGRPCPAPSMVARRWSTSSNSRRPPPLMCRCLHPVGPTQTFKFEREIAQRGSWSMSIEPKPVCCTVPRGIRHDYV